MFAEQNLLSVVEIHADRVRVFADSAGFSGFSGFSASMQVQNARQSV